MNGNKIQTAHSKHRYYREFAYKTHENEGITELYRLRTSPVKSDSVLELLIDSFSTRKGQYISVYSFSELDSSGVIVYESAKIDRVYFDFDCRDNPQRAVDEALLVTRALTANKIYPRFYFSGSKGVAMYIEFMTVDLENENKKPVIATFFDMVKGITEQQFNTELTTMDIQVRGDIARVSRLPNTKHASGYYCIPVTIADLKKGINHIRKLASTPVEDYDLDNEIAALMLKNSAARQIILNLEKKVIAEQNKKTVKKEVKQRRIAAHIKLNGRQPGSIIDEDIESAKNISLADLAGLNNKIVCPFHADTHPSLSIDLKKNLWYCFGCGRGGSTIDYVMERDGLNFIDAVKRLNTEGVVA